MAVPPVGPLIAGRRHWHLEGNFWQEDSTCLTWLDQQPEDSVIYVAFGSLTIFNQYQFQELALGLVLSGKRCLWIVLPDLIDDGSEEEDGYYPDGFTDRVSDRGRIVGWSPKQKVIAHPGIACFFTHCGWNSTTERLSNGVPFLCWPYNSDQFLNMAYITNVWKVGLEVKAESGDGIISGEVIRRKLDELVGAKEIRARSLEPKALERKNHFGAFTWHQTEDELTNTIRKTGKKIKLNGEAGYRSPYLSHAKRALYHLSYIPLMTILQILNIQFVK
ncbi:hypothetical protein ACLOJK_023665 [Asimina triloba]